MIRSLGRFLWIEVAPRWRRILLTGDVFLTAVVGGVLAWAWQNQHDLTPKAAEVVSALLNYGSIAFGFAITGLTMALALGDSDFVRKMTVTHSDGSKHSSYSDLLFVYAWTALAHVLLIAVCLFCMFVYEADELFFAAGLTAVERGFSIALACLSTYCVMHFLIMVLTLSSLGRVYAAHVGRKE
jgi:hypothetical protein